MIRPMAGWLLAAAMAGWLLAAAALATDDVGRAWQRVPGASYRGEDLPMAATILNRFLLDAYGHAAVPCDALDLGDLDAMRRELLAVRDDALDSIYREAVDKRALRTSDWAASRAEEMSLAAASTTAHNALRDAACHEVAMIFTHHLAAGARADVARAMTLPLLPTARRAPLAPGLLRDRVAAMTTCSGCHTTEVPDGTPPNPPDLAGSPRLLPEAWRAYDSQKAESSPASRSALTRRARVARSSVSRFSADLVASLSTSRTRSDTQPSTSSVRTLTRRVPSLAVASRSATTRVPGSMMPAMDDWSSTPLRTTAPFRADT